ncbi:hypothetical protein HMPREF3190_00977 [Umbribacter vaginalis]|nr:hypothetical protein HMPREF3190_00977 [Coriobacteriales bacterium DNF00809]
MCSYCKARALLQRQHTAQCAKLRAQWHAVYVCSMFLPHFHNSFPVLRSGISACYWRINDVFLQYFPL